MIDAVAIAVSAHNEERLLPACLRALRHSVGTLRTSVHLLVVADACSDQIRPSRWRGRAVPR